jgi:large subunit ribosomal protein L6
LVVSSYSPFGKYMSRLGKQPITLPAGVTATFEAGVLKISGPKATLERRVVPSVIVTIDNGVMTFAPASDEARAHWGTTASHAHNMIKGVTEGFTKILEIEGVGYRAELKGTNLVLSMGFSHPVEMAVPAGLIVTVEKSVITISGSDIEQLGQFAADVRAVKKPEPYKGKGIRYRGEFIIRKQGKKAS